ncbi:uncharacterized protein METZ01_LOCUS113719 [marine metagenome]|uniref:Uncharacterized protein n=1 Tax=marine metagenome TaxID=408172 RepID=A0A381X7X3_9ZZZZ
MPLDQRMTILSLRHCRPGAKQEHAGAKRKEES